MSAKVAVIIPCYKAKNKVGTLFKNLLDITPNLCQICELKFFLVNDNCPDDSYSEVPESNLINIIHNDENLGVGASSIAGFQEALRYGYEIFIKMDADGQHPPDYLLELIPYLLTLSKKELYLVKGTRYHFPIDYENIPFDRRIGSYLLEPMARMSLIYKGLTDVANGFLSINKITLKYLLSNKFKNKIELRYLFECSIIKRCSSLRVNIHQFPMQSIYGDKWSSSMNSRKMVFPLLRFWTLSLIKEIFYKYLFRLNLGTFFLLSSAINFFISFLYLFIHILPKINSNIFVTAGNASIFSATLVISILFLSLFILYDYSKKKSVEIVFFDKFSE